MYRSVISSLSNGGSQITKNLFCNKSGLLTHVTRGVRNYSSQPTKEELLESYNQEYKYAITNNEEYWDDKASKYIHWNKRYDHVRSGTDEKPEWFAGGKLNICYNALDRHVKDPVVKNRYALISEVPLYGVVEKVTYGELYERVVEFSTALINLGVTKGDRVVIYMPTTTVGIIAMLACSRIGATHSVVFGGFAAPQLANRIDHCQPKAVISSSFGVEGLRIQHYTPLLDKALKLCKHKPQHVIVNNRKDIKLDESVVKLDYALDWDELTKSARRMLDSTYSIVDSSHPLYILYTSGTTGSPKGILRETGGHAVAVAHFMTNSFGSKEGDVFFSSSDIGWVVGHTLSVYGPLIRAMTSVVYEGKPVIPDAGVFWRIISEHKVNVLFSAPTAVRAIQKIDPEGALPKKYDLSSLQSIWLGGERGDPETLKYFAKISGAPVYDSYWQTESGWGMITNSLKRIPVKYGSAGKPMPGLQLHVLGPDGKQVEDGETGEIMAKLPLPPCYATTLYLNHPQYEKSYLSTHKGYYRTGDAGFRDKEGYFYVMTRVDDIINTSGHRLSTAAIEEILYAYPNVVECAVVGVNDEIKGEIPFGYVVLKQGEEFTPEIENGIIKAVRDKIGPVATFKKVLGVKRLPKTRSGKIVRSILRAISNQHEHYNVPPTIEDEEVPLEIEGEFKKYLKTHEMSS